MADGFSWMRRNQDKTNTTRCASAPSEYCKALFPPVLLLLVFIAFPVVFGGMLNMKNLPQRDLGGFNQRPSSSTALNSLSNLSLALQSNRGRTRLLNSKRRLFQRSSIITITHLIILKKMALKSFLSNLKCIGQIEYHFFV